ncbi:unnamed protein product [Blepharisma stoltei]|uniref:Spindle assembly abnormal protein 6 N-terminal domain-containing protein n=1 Tax=Blepharisma stoltei TaxID=1481888 RepID=A0AAU9JGA0_9CILI|nr:unnamed protein product [Blepharisma stoltei]
MEGLSKIEVTVNEVYSPKELSSSLICKVFLKDQVKSVQHPFNSPFIFDILNLTQDDILIVSLEDSSQELAFAEIRIGDILSDLRGSIMQWVKLISRKSPSNRFHQLYEESEQSYRIQVQISIRNSSGVQASTSNQQKSTTRLDLNTSPEGNQGCPRCMYLVRLAESQTYELLALEESKSTYSDIKQLLKDYYANEQPSYSRLLYSNAEELGIDLPMQMGQKGPQVSKQEAEHLREVILGLNEKLKGLQIMQDEVQQIRKQLHDSQVNRLILQESVRKATCELEEKCKQQSDKHSQSIEERAKAMQNLLDQQHLYNQKCLEQDELNSSLATLNASLKELKAEEFNYLTMKEHISRLETELKVSENKRDELRSEYRNSIQQFENQKKKQIENINRLNEEKAQLLKDIKNLQSQLFDQKNVNEELTKVNLDLESTIKELEGEIKVLEDETTEISEARNIAEKKENKCIFLQTEIHKTAKTFEEELADISRINQNLLKEKSDVVNTLNELENILENKTEEIQDLTHTNFNLMNKTINLELQLCSQHDQENIRQALEHQLNMNENIKSILLQELNQLTEYLEKQTSECLALSRTVESCKRMVDEKCIEKENMQKIVGDLRQTRPLYVTVKGDLIDEKFGSVLNERKDWYDLMIYRKNSGVYNIGSKEVGMSLNDNQLMVRLGKGIMTIEEFLNTYIPLEKNKKQFSTPVVMRQQIAIHEISQ